MEKLKVVVGQWVWTIRDNWTKVDCMADSGPFPLLINGCNYKADGKLYEHHENPAVFLTNPFDKNDGPPCQFKEGEVIKVSDYVETLDDSGSINVFMGYDYGQSYPYKVRGGLRWKYARKLNATERGENS